MKGAARIEAFLEMMSAERGASDNTLQSYRRDLEDAAENVPGNIAEAGTAELRLYIAGLAGRGFASSSQARKLSALRQFYKFLYAEGLRGDDPTGGRRVISSPRCGLTGQDSDGHSLTTLARASGLQASHERV